MIFHLKNLTLNVDFTMDFPSYSDAVRFLRRHRHDFITMRELSPNLSHHVDIKEIDKSLQLNSGEVYFPD